jgi:two-component system, OmpR family, sensor kinase
MSLRRTILIWITVLLAIVGAAATAASYHFAKREADKLLDNELQQIAVNAGEGLTGDAHPAATKKGEDELVIQTWNASGERILQTSMIDLPRQLTLGFSDVEFGGKSWRVYTASDGQRTSQVAQRWSARNELAGNAALGAALPILAAIPITWLVVIWAVNRLLRRLSGVAESLAKRSVDARDPIPLADVPSEIAPLNVAMNALIGRHQRAVERQRRFVSDAAHELRTPLSALQIQVDNLRTRTKAKSGVQREVVDELNAGVRRAIALVEQLLKMARLEDGARPGDRGDIGLKDLVGTVVADQVALATQKDIDLGLSVSDAFDVRLADPEARLLFANLVDNAVRYTPSGGTVDVVVSKRGSDAVVEVVDSGCGIPDAALPRIFDRFFRAAPPGVEGTGLGLAIAKAIADRNGFGLTIDNRQGAAGVVARVEIPQSGRWSSVRTPAGKLEPAAGNPPLNRPH